MQPPESSAARIPPGVKGVNVVQEEGPVGGVPEPGGLPAAQDRWPDGSADECPKCGFLHAYDRSCEDRASSAAQGQYRELTPEQYAQGYLLPGGYRAWFGPILRVTEDGTYIVREPKREASRDAWHAGFKRVSRV